MSDLPLLPVYVAGVWPASAWFIRLTLELKRHPDKVFHEDIEETSRDAYLAAVDDQLRVGADIVSCTLGLPGVVEGLSLLDRVSGLEPLRARRHLVSRLFSETPMYHATKPLLALRGLGVAAEAERLASITSSPSVASLPGPYTLAGLIQGGPSRLANASSLCTILRAEIESLASIGISVVQLDEPGFAWSQEEPTMLADLIRRTVDGIPVEISLRLGYLDSYGRPVNRRRYHPWLLDIANAVSAATINVRQFDLAFGSSEMAEIQVLKEMPARRVALGIIDVSCSWVEPVSLLAERLKLALEHLPPERIWVTADGGLGALTRPVAIRKVFNLVEAARQVREELGVRVVSQPGAMPGPETPVRDANLDFVVASGLESENGAISS